MRVNFENFGPTTKNTIFRLVKLCYVRPPHRKIHIEKQRRILCRGRGAFD